MKDTLQQGLKDKARVYTLEVSGALACFTRPEMKVERVSYGVITPSAARAIFESIYWKPQIRWRIVRIEVMKPIAFHHIQRCEVAAMAHNKKNHIIASDYRQLRSSLLLRDVSYRLTAQMEVLQQASNIELENTSAKHCAIFERRASRGQCFTQPYLGCREFSANWKWVQESENMAIWENSDCHKPIPETRDFGVMLYDIDFSDSENPQPVFFNAVMSDGVINIPHL